jgi:hypothetical protein
MPFLLPRVQFAEIITHIVSANGGKINAHAGIPSLFKSNYVRHFCYRSANQSKKHDMCLHADKHMYFQHQKKLVYKKKYFLEFTILFPLMQLQILRDESFKKVYFT